MGADEESGAAERLEGLDIPTFVRWGDIGRIADPNDGRAYADSIPNARFQILTGVGHLPQVEDPKAVLRAIYNDGLSLAPRKGRSGDL